MLQFIAWVCTASVFSFYHQARNTEISSSLPNWSMQNTTSYHFVDAHAERPVQICWELAVIATPRKIWHSIDIRISGSMASVQNVLGVQNSTSNHTHWKQKLIPGQINSKFQLMVWTLFNFILHLKCCGHICREDVSETPAQEGHGRVSREPYCRVSWESCCRYGNGSYYGRRSK